MTRTLVVAALLALACGGGQGDVPSVDARANDAGPGRSPGGGWVASEDETFACFDATTMRVAFGTTVAEVTTEPCCWYGSDGYGEGDLYFQSGRRGTWRMTDDEHLFLSSDPPCGDACGPVEYRRELGLRCAFP